MIIHLYLDKYVRIEPQMSKWSLNLLLKEEKYEIPIKDHDFPTNYMTDEPFFNKFISLFFI